MECWGEETECSFQQGDQKSLTPKVTTARKHQDEEVGLQNSKGRAFLGKESGAGPSCSKKSSCPGVRRVESMRRGGRGCGAPGCIGTGKPLPKSMTVTQSIRVLPKTLCLFLCGSRPSLTLKSTHPPYPLWL